MDLSSLSAVSLQFYFNVILLHAFYVFLFAFVVNITWKTNILVQKLI